MSVPLGIRLARERGPTGLSQEQMGKLFDWSQSAYQRVEAGGSRHQRTTLDHIDDVMLAHRQEFGWTWHRGLAAELEFGEGSGLIERLDRIEATQVAIGEQLTRLNGTSDVLRRIRQLLAEI